MSTVVFLEKLQLSLMSFLKQYSTIEAAGQNSKSQIMEAKQEISGLLSELDNYKKRYNSINKTLKVSFSWKKNLTENKNK